MFTTTILKGAKINASSANSHMNEYQKGKIKTTKEACCANNNKNRATINNKNKNFHWLKILARISL